MTVQLKYTVAVIAMMLVIFITKLLFNMHQSLCTKVLYVHFEFILTTAL